MGVEVDVSLKKKRKPSESPPIRAYRYGLNRVEPTPRTDLF